MADPDFEIRGGEGGGHPDPEIRGRTRSPKTFFSVLRASFWSKNKRWGGGGGTCPPGPSPGSASSFIFLPCLLSCALFPKLPFMTIGHFLVSPGLRMKTRLTSSPLMKMIFHFHANETHAFSQESLGTWLHFESEGFLELGRGLLKIALLW